MARPPWLLLLAVLLYLAFRAAVLHTAFDDVCLPPYELHNKGGLALAASEGVWGAPLHRYYDNCGGHVVTGLLAAPLYRLLGDSYLVLKLVPLGLGLLALLLLWHLLDRLADRRAADLAALLFALAPPTLSKFSLIAMGNHFESLPVQLALLLVVTSAWRAGAPPRRLFAAGLAAGFSIFFYFGSLTLLLLLAGLHLLVRGPRRAAADLLPALPGLLLGLLPLLAIEHASGGRVSHFLAHHAAGGDRAVGAGEPLERLGELLLTALPRATVFEDLGPIPGRAADAAWYALFALAWLLLLPDAARRLQAALRRGPAGESAAAATTRRAAALGPLPFVLYFPVFVAVFSRSDFRLTSFPEPVEVGGFRYLVPHHLVSLAVIALAASAARARGPAGRRLGAALAAAALLLAAAFTLPMISLDRSTWGRGSRYAGHDLPRWGALLVRDDPRDGERLLLDHAELQDGLATLPPSWRPPVLAGLGLLAARNHGDVPPLRLASLLAPWPAEQQPDVARGAGTHLATLLLSPDASERERGAAGLSALAGEAHALLPHALAGLAQPPRFLLARQTAEHLLAAEALAASLPPGLAAPAGEGLGIRAGHLLARGIGPDRALVTALGARVAPPLAAGFWRGVGTGLGEGPGPAGWPDAPLAAVPPEHEDAVLAALAAALVRVHGPHAAGLAAALPLPDEQRARVLGALGRGASP